MVQQKMAKVAFIIQCHKDPEQIHLLTEGLRQIFNCRIFLHLDKKSEGLRPQLDTNKLTLLSAEKSEDVRWGTFSQCKATLALIEEVLSAEEKFDYVWLISGQDLPIVSQEQAEHLLPETPVPFIEVMGPEHLMYRNFSKRNDIFYPEWLMERTLFSHIALKLYLQITGGVGHTWSIFRRELGVPYYFGSSWWCLPYDCLEEMMGILKSNRQYVDYFKNAANADESFFQTLFMQTSYAGRQEKIPTYIDWAQGQASPRTLTMEQWDDLVAAKGKYAFARKFDLSVDQEVCHRVITQLCGISLEEN